VSFEITIASSRPPDPKAIQGTLNLPDLRGLGDAVSDWNAGVSLHRHGISTRATQVTWGKGRANVVVRAFASHEDCDLALRLTEAIAAAAGRKEVNAERFGKVTPAALRKLCDRSWERLQADSGTRTISTMIGEGKGPMAIPGPVRHCHIGQRLLGELERAGTPEDLSDRFIEAIRRVQWSVPDGFRDAGVFVSGEKPGQKGKRFAVWLPEENLVLPSVDSVILSIDEEPAVTVPFETVPELAGSYGELLDECQLLVRVIPPDEWQRIVARARAVPGARA
jgi:hypothetical protein